MTGPLVNNTPLEVQTRLRRVEEDVKWLMKQESRDLRFAVGEDNLDVVQTVLVEISLELKRMRAQWKTG